MHEEIKYGIKPSGHYNPEPERKEIVPSNDLWQAFLEWQAKPKRVDVKDEVFGQYLSALEIVERLDRISVDEAHGLLVACEHQQWDKSQGLFVSAVYNTCADELIHFDGKTSFHFLAYKLERKKVFINRGSIGAFTGQHSQGLLINYSSADAVFGIDHFSKGVLNYGTVNGYFGEGSSSVAINLSDAGKYLGQSAKGIVINFGNGQSPFNLEEHTIFVNAGKLEMLDAICQNGHVFYLVPPTNQYPLVGLTPQGKTYNHLMCAQIPGLHNYFDDLKQKLERGRTDEQEAIKVMKTLSREQIEHDLEKMVKAAGFEW